MNASTPGAGGRRGGSGPAGLLNRRLDVRGQGIDGELLMGLSGIRLE